MGKPATVRRGYVFELQILLGLVLLGLWQWLATVKLLDPFFVSRPSAILTRIATWISTGTLWRHLATTLEEALLGLIIGSALGIALGFVFARSPLVAAVCDPYIKMLNAIPRVAPRYSPTTAPTIANPRLVCRLEKIHVSALGTST